MEQSLNRESQRQRECAYRRGVQHGVNFAIDLLEKGYTRQQLCRYCDYIAEWREHNVDTVEPPRCLPAERLPEGWQRDMIGTAMSNQPAAGHSCLRCHFFGDSVPADVRIGWPGKWDYECFSHWLAHDHKTIALEMMRGCKQGKKTVVEWLGVVQKAEQ